MKRLAINDLDEIKLNYGKHCSADQGHCLLEVVSMFAGETFNDYPICVDPALTIFGISWNDGLRSDDEREQLKQYVARLAGTNKGPELAQKRGWMAMDWLVRVHCATWLALNPGLAHHAETLKSLPPITCVAELTAAQPKLNAARADSRATGDAAWDTTWDTARDAAWDAARDAARGAVGDAAWAAAWAAVGDATWDTARDAARGAVGDAAWAAAWDAVRDAARDATWDTARDAAWAKLETTTKELQSSAHDLFSRMIDAEIK